MEKNKRISWLLGILLVLVVVAYATGTFDVAPSTIDVPQIEINADDIESLTIVRPEFSIHTQKSNGVWQINEPVSWLADSSSLASFLRSLSELDVESVVSTNPERYAQYGVDSTGTRVTIQSDGDERQFVFASEGPDYSTTFLRVDADERVFAGRPRIYLPADANAWRDKMVARVPIENLTVIGVRTPDENFALEKGDDGWHFQSDDEVEVAADSSALATWLRNFTSLRADGFLPLDTEIEGETNILAFQTATGESFNFHIIEMENELALRYSDQPMAVYKLYSSRAATLIPELSVLQGN